MSFTPGNSSVSDTAAAHLQLISVLEHVYLALQQAVLGIRRSSRPWPAQVLTALTFMTHATMIRKPQDASEL